MLLDKRGRPADSERRRKAGCRVANLIEAILAILAGAAETDDRSSSIENFPAVIVAAGPRNVHDGSAAPQVDQRLRRNAG